jgi:hypothetical protein
MCQAKASQPSRFANAVHARIAQTLWVSAPLQPMKISLPQLNSH